jgi:hypothetical protein
MKSADCINLHEAALIILVCVDLDKKYDFRILVNSSAIGDKGYSNEYFSVPFWQ